jgi:hypothetical protein
MGANKFGPPGWHEDPEYRHGGATAKHSGQGW